MIDPDDWDMWEFFNVPYAGYNEKLDEDFINVIEKTLDPDRRFNSKIAEDLGLSQEYVELMQCILCGSGLWEYGGSPRGCWPCDNEKVEEILKMCKIYYEKQWAD